MVSNASSYVLAVALPRNLDRPGQQVMVRPVWLAR